MAITIDGTNKLIVLDTATSFTAQAIYDACVVWAVLTGNMQFLLPMDGSGGAALGGGIFTDLVRRLINGYKLKPSGYAANTQITVAGTLITSDNTAYAVPPTTGSPVSWFVQAATAGTISVVSGASTLTTVEHDKLMGLPDAATTAVATAAALQLIARADGLTAAQAEIVNDAILHGTVTGAGTATESFWSVNQAGTTMERVRITVDASGNRTAVTFPDVNP